MRLADFSRLFRSEQEDADGVRLEYCREVLDWMSAAHHKKFMAWLEENSLSKIPVSGGHMDLVQSTVRSNTFREVRAHLIQLERECKATLDEFRENA